MIIVITRNLRTLVFYIIKITIFICATLFVFGQQRQIHCKKIGTRSVHVGSRKKISEVSQVISGFVMPHLLHYSVPLYLLHLQICLLGNPLVPISSHPARPKMVCKSMINSHQEYNHGLARVNFVRTHEWKLISEKSKFSF